MKKLYFAPGRQHIAAYDNFLFALPCEAKDENGRNIGYRVDIFERKVAWNESGISPAPDNITEGPTCYEVRAAWTRDGQEHGCMLKATYTESIQWAHHIAGDMQATANRKALRRYGDSTAYHIAKANYRQAIDQAAEWASTEAAIEAYAENARQSMTSAGYPAEACETAAEIVSTTYRNNSRKN